MRFDRERLSVAARILVWSLAFTTACAGLAGLWWLFELFVHFRLQYLISGLLLGAVLWALHRRRMAALALLLAGVNAIAILPVLLVPVNAAPPRAGAALHVVSLNVFGFNRQYARVREYLRSERPDVAVLLEITPDWERELQPLRSEFAYIWVVPTGERAGMAVLSRAAPLATREVDLGNTGEPSLLLTLDRPGGAISVLGTHLYWPLGPYASLVRNRQMVSIAGLARAHDKPLIVAGDFNATPFSPQFARLLSDGRLSNCAGGAGIAPTWPAWVPFLLISIDHCLISSGLSAGNFRVGGYVGSDHYPIAADVWAARAAPRPAAGPSPDR